MHPKISVAVPTRHRPDIHNRFIETFYESLLEDDVEPKDEPHLLTIYDAPEKLSSGVHGYYSEEVTFYDKSSLTELWNQCIILSPTDWVLICNDDIEFKTGWLEYLEKTIKTGLYDLIHLFHYGAFCIHKSLILKIGWFDEDFRYGSYEDNDFQLRISEAGLKDRVDQSHDFIRREGGREIGHFIDHTKYLYKDSEGWQGDNSAHIKRKWQTNLNWKQAVFRSYVEKDWHPAYTNKLVDKFGIDREWVKTNFRSIEYEQGILH